MRASSPSSRWRAIPADGANICCGVAATPRSTPWGACVGMRGSRVQAVVNELQGEKIDIIQWSPDAATSSSMRWLRPRWSKVVLDEDAERIEVVVPDQQLSLAIGRKGQNVRLASQLTGWDIDIMTEASESERRQAEFAERSSTFMEALDRPTRSSPSCSPPKASARLKKWPLSSRRRSPRSRASTRTPPPEIQTRARGASREA